MMTKPYPTLQPYKTYELTCPDCNGRMHRAYTYDRYLGHFETPFRCDCRGYWIRTVAIIGSEVSWRFEPLHKGKQDD